MPTHGLTLLGPAPSANRVTGGKLSRQGQVAGLDLHPPALGVTIGIDRCEQWRLV